MKMNKRVTDDMRGQQAVYGKLNEKEHRMSKELDIGKMSHETANELRGAVRRLLDTKDVMLDEGRPIGAVMVMTHRDDSDGSIGHGVMMSGACNPFDILEVMGRVFAEQMGLTVEQLVPALVSGVCQALNNVEAGGRA